MKIIDPHLHLFDLTKGEYSWLKPENPPFWPDKKVITRNFIVDDLQLVAPLSLAGFVHIEAGFNNEQPSQEITWLESLNTQTPFKSVAYIDITLASSKFIEHIAMLQSFKSIVGCRHILGDDIERIITQPQVRKNLALIAQKSWIFELQTTLMSNKVTNCIIELCEDIPKLTMIINHAGFVPAEINSQAWNNWQQQLAMLAQLKQIAIKCSGWEMVDRNYSVDWLRANIEQIIKYFGADRVMLASNFPLTLFSQSYHSLWHQYIEQLNLSEQVKHQVCYQTAKNWYRF